MSFCTDEAGQRRSCRVHLECKQTAEAERSERKWKKNEQQWESDEWKDLRMVFWADVSSDEVKMLMNIHQTSTVSRCYLLKRLDFWVSFSGQSMSPIPGRRLWKVPLQKSRWPEDEPYHLRPLGAEQSKLRLWLSSISGSEQGRVFINCVSLFRRLC